jgi:hypothetical protein
MDDSQTPREGIESTGKQLLETQSPMRYLLTAYAERRFLVLLIALLLFVVVPPITFGIGLDRLWVDAFFCLVVLAAILSLCYERRQRLFAWLAGMPTIFALLIGDALAGPVQDVVLAVGHFAGVVFLFAASVLTVSSVFRQHQITADSIFGAICGYLLLGVAWGVLYATVEFLSPGSFNIGDQLLQVIHTGRDRTNVLIYYSFVTLTTVGYGDVTPVTLPARTCAWAEAMTGQFYLAVVVAGLVSVLVTKRVES